MNKTLKQQQEKFDERLKYHQIYLDHMISENNRLKHQLSDMQQTAIQNKNLLKDYIENITSHDKIVQRLQCTIDTLQERVKSQEDIIKKLLKQLENTGDDEIVKKTNSNLIKNQRTIGNKISNVIENDNMSAKTNNEISQNRQLFVSQRLVENLPTPNTAHNTVSNTTQQHNVNSTNGILAIQNEKKEIKNNQALLIEQISTLKQELQYLLDNVEIFYKNKKEKKRDLDRSYEDAYSLNCSFASEVSTHTIKRRQNLNEKFNNVNKLQDLLLNYVPHKSLILLVDNKLGLWELVKRNDLDYSCLSNSENISSIVVNKIDDNKLLNIEIKDNYDTRSLNNSEIDLSRNNDINISMLLKDNNEN